jgi:hypothetical protein
LPINNLKLDIIPDIHADFGRLVSTLSHLGYKQTEKSWVHPEGRIAAFLGDFIDTGEQNAEVISVVRAMEQRGHAIAIMGNHELNALLYHERGANSESSADGFMRAHSPKNTAQHQTFLKEFPVGASRTREVLDWFLTLPLFFEVPGLRLVHAYWASGHVDTIRRRRIDGRLQRNDLQELAFENRATAFAKAVLSSLKGPEAELPDGHSFEDIKGHPRTAIRVKWWQADVRTWRAAALSVPTPDQLPDTPVTEDHQIKFYETGERPVFFGHYKMPGEPELIVRNALCLDYPYRACAYRWNGETELKGGSLISIPGKIRAI